MIRRLFLALSLALVAAAPLAAARSRTWPPVNVLEGGPAVGGYDPVSYFTEDGPVMGDPAISLDWNGATWRFATTAHRDAFRANPEAYAPQFGGYCAWAASQGYIAPGDPLIWRIVDGRLYLNFNARAQSLWEGDLPDAIARGQANWPRILTQNQG